MWVTKSICRLLAVQYWPASSLTPRCVPLDLLLVTNQSCTHCLSGWVMSFSMLRYLASMNRGKGMAGDAQEVAHKVAADLAKLSAEELVRTANDSAGSRVVEAALANCTRNKVKQKVIKKLLGSIGALATSPGGSHVVDKCFSEAVGFHPGSYLFFKCLRV